MLLSTPYDCLTVLANNLSVSTKRPMSALLSRAFVYYGRVVMPPLPRPHRKKDTDSRVRYCPPSGGEVLVRPVKMC